MLVIMYSSFYNGIYAVGMTAIYTNFLSQEGILEATDTAFTMGHISGLRTTEGWILEYLTTLY
jgi:hypothetical protein